MKSLGVTATLLGAMLVAGSAQAAGGTYFAAQGALADVDGFDEGLALTATVGMPAGTAAPNLAFEGELGLSLIDPQRDTVAGDVEASYWYLAGFGVYNLPLNNGWALRGRLGIGYLDTEVRSPGGNVADDSDLEAMLGVGMTIPVNSTMRFITEYTRIEADIGHLSAGVQFDF